ncbi:hypothetical protein [Agrobacterium tumefaciens]|nr:hypothetical protein [Agrobacterium tumefaciens]NTD84346.1 hypothetical protein [Agrobacterium tumefaciens]NTD94662.1 hypothetical protein [Agrobacterium tumefaciens]NTD96113.1 hypothetical protein [Agrobacterium tumefaciens]NTE13972.1 hypothetical protein [Agrobacterium tumefaciens]NTE19586.1 hypothetical protein [Agrobacterium tumefaciens]
MTFITAAIAATIGAASAGTFFASLGTCLLITNLEEFDMEYYHDRH